MIRRNQAKTITDLCGQNRLCASCPNVNKIFVAENPKLGAPYTLYYLENKERATTARFFGKSFSPPEMLHGSDEFYCSREPKSYEYSYDHPLIEDMVQSFPNLKKVDRLVFETEQESSIAPWKRGQSCHRHKKYDWNWITALNPLIDDPCKTAESRHPKAFGTCHRLKYTSKHFWICHEGYTGDNCEEKVEIDDGQVCQNKTLESCTGLDYLKSSLVESNGLPTLVDVWSEVVVIADKITQSIKSATEEIRFDIKHQDTLTDAAILLRLHHDYTFGNDPESYFMQHVDSFLDNKLLIGFLTRMESFIKADHLKFAKKSLAKKYQEQGICSQMYLQEVETFKNNVKNMLAVIAYTLLKHNRYYNTLVCDVTHVFLAKIELLSSLPLPS